MARVMGFREADSEDLVQDVFTVFLATLDRFEGRSQVGTWLFGILHHKMRERRRALQQMDAHDSVDSEFNALFTAYGHWISPLQDLERAFESLEIGENLSDCLALLPLPQREVFVLREVDELSSQEICKKLDISNTNLGVLIHRARHRLRECMRGKGWR